MPPRSGVLEKGLGKGMAPFDVALDRHTVFETDFSCNRTERLDLVTEHHVSGAPDLVVEILSGRRGTWTLGRSCAPAPRTLAVHTGSWTWTWTWTRTPCRPKAGTLGREGETAFLGERPKVDAILACGRHGDRPARHFGPRHDERARAAGVRQTRRVHIAPWDRATVSDPGRVRRPASCGSAMRYARLGPPGAGGSVRRARSAMRGITSGTPPFRRLGDGARLVYDSRERKRAERATVQDRTGSARGRARHGAKPLLPGRSRVVWRMAKCGARGCDGWGDPRDTSGSRRLRVIR